MSVWQSQLMDASPEGLLPDGMAFVGRLGEVAYDPDEDRVQCHLCGGWLRKLGGSHLERTHGWTLAHYRDVFQLPQRAPLCARNLSAVQGPKVGSASATLSAAPNSASSAIDKPASVIGTVGVAPT